ncbi:hypothetical protein [Chitinimonas taiwanensis]|uniref:Uncharacterized protein n=1 Tax=Chitinimonas taiwanensis DSM 18899 TaxID=1121279 RepID=A0A1K2HKP0_9NEIS|nr:hypothetical protein [Chitinimonas taiwanensis]SFZ77388.1 hypothetical protein SAMN02745887_02392 [Chitinimonas taiwanensis DSM 18899]
MNAMNSIFRPLAVILFCMTANAQEDGSRVWIECPWDFRYILKIDEPSRFEIRRELGKQELARTPLDFGRSHLLETIIPPVQVFDIPNEYWEANNKVATLLMTFDEQGRLASPYEWPFTLSGKLNRLRYLILAPGNAANDLQFDIGEWYTGRSSDEVAYIPAICSMTDMGERYRKGFKADTIDGNFGCREWGYYLQSDQFPYIVITSYQWENDYEKPKNKKGKYPQMLATYIRPVIGWGRFDTPPKPFIGQHGKNWVCLHECPDGEAPGIIPDIKAWTAKRGWPLPKPPKKQPMFPDRAYQRGEFID